MEKEKQLKPKLHAVVVDGMVTLVLARTKQGAITAVIEEAVKVMREAATVDLASDEQIYLAGMKGQRVLGDSAERYSPTTPVDDRQLDAFHTGPSLAKQIADDIASGDFVGKPEGFGAEYIAGIAADEGRKHPEAVGS